jgi:hypothetical protein
MKYARKYDAGIRGFDETATAGEMQGCADSHRQQYQKPDGQDKNRHKAEAAYCQALADKKRWQR